MIKSECGEHHIAGDLAADFEVESLHDVTRLVERLRSPG
jgi:transcriptional regulator of NAD metabolism